MAAQASQLLRFAVRRTLQFEINHLAAGRCSFGQNVELGGHRTPELASGRDPAASGQCHHVRVILGKLLELRERQRGARQVV